MAQVALSDAVKSAILETLLDSPLREILTLTTEKAFSVEEISLATRVPISTCYRAVRTLEQKGLVIRTGIVLSPSEKRYYRAAFRQLHLILDSNGVKVEVEPSTGHS